MPAPLFGEMMVRGFEPEDAVRGALEQLGEPPSCIVVFTARRGSIDQVAIRIAQLVGSTSTAVIECGGVLGHLGENESDGIAAVAYANRPDAGATLVALGGDVDETASRVREHATGSTLLTLLLTPPLYGPRLPKALEPVVPPDIAIVGGGARKAAILAPGLKTNPVDGVMIVLRAPGVKVARATSPAARLLTDWRTLTDTQDNFLVATDGGPMIDWVTHAGGPTEPGVPMFVAIRAKTPGAAPLLRTVAGMDPRRGVAVVEPVEEGHQVALAAWDGTAARNDLKVRVDELAAAVGTGTVVGAVLVTCVGRGTDLFGTPDVDVAALGSRFGGVPVTGMFSQFELARFDGVPRVHLYTAAMFVLYRPGT